MPILHIKFFSVDFIYFKTKRKPDRLFVGEDQKILSIAMHLKRLYDNFIQIYVTVPDLEFWKSLMHVILTQCKFLGFKHLAKLGGHTTNNQWEWALSNSAPTTAHRSPPTTIIHPKYLPIQNNAPYTPPTQNNVPSTQNNPHSPKIMPH